MSREEDVSNKIAQGLQLVDDVTTWYVQARLGGAEQTRVEEQECYSAVRSVLCVFLGLAAGSKNLE